MPEIVFISDHTNILTDPSLWWFRAAPITHMHLLITTMWAGGNKSLDQENLRGERASADQGLALTHSYLLVLVTFPRINQWSSQYLWDLWHASGSEAMPHSHHDPVCVIPPLVTEISQKYLPPLHSPVSVVRLCKSGTGVIGPELVKCHDSEMF